MKLAAAPTRTRFDEMLEREQRRIDAARHLIAEGNADRARGNALEQDPFAGSNAPAQACYTRAREKYDRAARLLLGDDSALDA